MDLLLPTGFSPYYPADETQDVLALDEDAFMWSDSLSEFPHSLPVTRSEECISSNLWTHLPLPDPGSFDLPPSGSSTSHSAPSSSHSPKDHPRHSNGNGYASSESSSSSLECSRKGKRARVSFDPCQLPLMVRGSPVYLACRECESHWGPRPAACRHGEVDLVKLVHAAGHGRRHRAAGGRDTAQGFNAGPYIAVPLVYHGFCWAHRAGPHPCLQIGIPPP
ncbi:hypothetical protein LXA43DRAFT_322280 [Ganoderma leucocontextum]|nr:hypothetical protein LXA43DRAFT_322280 [Ganoderma leucocontextum]